MDVGYMQGLLSARRLGRRVVWHGVTDSTNTRGRAAVEAGACADGWVFAAGAQTGGRGTGGRTWVSGEAAGLWCSLVLVEPVVWEVLPLLAGIALAGALRDQWGVRSHLKWPNDVMIDERKLAGILVEAARAPGGERAAIVGLGVNLRQTQFEGAIADTAVSLRQVIGRDVPTEAMLAAWLNQMEMLLDGGADVRSMWLSMTQMIGRTVKVRHRDGEATVRIINLNERGELIVSDESGAERALIAAGELGNKC
ncbi:MAG: biotin--[acetyl-CoA-carboxylase] ligase [Planctomycetes bacterium]|nr:biotin--[acetyl-CoA-carboxylase] ligase [Planctomycetota bacterium]